MGGGGISSFDSSAATWKVDEPREVRIVVPVNIEVRPTIKPNPIRKLALLKLKKANLSRDELRSLGVEDYEV
jgi:hypothetical protein